MNGRKRMRSIRDLMDSKSTAFIIGLTAIVLAAGAVTFAFNAVNGNPLATRKVVFASFKSVNGLLPGDDVRIASSRVGYVGKIRAEKTGGAVVELQIDDPTIPVYRNASATPAASTSARSTLGQKFVDLKVGTPSAGPLGAEEIIPQSNTRSAEELTELFDVFDDPTRKATGVTLREVGGGLAGRSTDFHDLLKAAPALLPNLGTVSESLAVRNGADLTRLMQSAKTLTTRFAGREQEIADLTRQLGTTLDGIAVDNGAALEQTIVDAPETLRVTREALDALRPVLDSTTTAVTTVRTGTESLGLSTPDIRNVFQKGIESLDKLPRVSTDAEPAVEELTSVATDAAPLTPRLHDVVDRAATPLKVLGPYSRDIAGWFTNATAVLKDGDSAGHWLRFYLLPRSESLSGTLPLRDPTTSREAYPAPGKAMTDRALSPLIGGTN